MLRSLYSGISGMKNFQTKLDVVANNVANVNTHGFKKSRITFKDMVSQTIQSSGGPTNNSGSINSKQVGLGASLASIDKIMTPGSAQNTGEPYDLYITGDGFFRIEKQGEILFTRTGNFKPDEAGDLVTPDGYYVLGMNGQKINVPKDNVTSVSIGPDGTVSVVENNVSRTVGQVSLAAFSNAGGLDLVGDNLYRQTLSSGAPSNAIVPGEQGTGIIQTARLEMSNVDLTDEFTEMIIAQRGFQSNAKTITTSDEILQELVNLKR
ncbi:flagellar basal body rod protein FlgG [Bacillus sp. 179-C3.3 HS]|uniref:flagellar basal body rod protein FlgG n=1 Tax=Bacillus sp. 179-C3.3 HS TaxID=3232162 RepID=UPI0039A27006